MDELKDVAIHDWGIKACVNERFLSREEFVKQLTIGAHEYIMK
jgi:hypothetical protein